MERVTKIKLALSAWEAGGSQNNVWPHANSRQNRQRTTDESGKPVHVAVGVGMVVGPSVQPFGKFVSHGPGASRQSALQREDNWGCDQSSTCRSVEQGDEVDGVLGDDDPVRGGCAIEYLVVGTAGETDVADVQRIMPEFGQGPGDRGAEHLVDEEPHEARKRSRSRAACSARSAAASLRRIIESTSSG